MSSVYFLVHDGSPFCDDLLYILKNTDTPVVCAKYRGTTAMEQESNEDCVFFSPSSPLSVKSLVKGLTQDYPDDVHALIPFPQFERAENLRQISPLDLENKIDTGLKGNLFIIRELLMAFEKTKSGAITLLIGQSSAAYKNTCIEPLILAFHAYGEQLFLQYSASNISVSGIEDAEKGSKIFFETLTELINGQREKKRGKWNRPGEKYALFGFGKKS